MPRRCCAGSDQHRPGAVSAAVGADGEAVNEAREMLDALLLANGADFAGLLAHAIEQFQA